MCTVQKNPRPIKTNHRFGGGVCLCICLFVPGVARASPLARPASRDFDYLKRIDLPGATNLRALRILNAKLQIYPNQQLKIMPSNYAKKGVNVINSDCSSTLAVKSQNYPNQQLK